MKLCPIIRRWAGVRAGDDSPLPRLVRSHIQRCADCSRLIAEERRIHSALLQSAPPAPALSPEFAANMLASLNSRRMAVDPVPAAHRAWRWGLATAGAACLLLWVLPRFSDTYDGTPGGAMPSPTRDAALTPIDQGWSSWAAVEHPLQSELRLAMEDGKLALRSLIGNFAPEETVDALLK